MAGETAATAVSDFSRKSGGSRPEIGRSKVKKIRMSPAGPEPEEKFKHQGNVLI
jgi:hypothetical protein